MSIECLIRRGEYHDSVRLMQIARELAGQPGVIDAAVVMATEANKAILREAGLLAGEILAAGPNDLVVAVRAESEAAGPALAEAERLLVGQAEAGSALGEARRPRTLHAAARGNPGANLAVVSVAGRYAAAEAWEALRHGLHVLLFSDNVSLEDEIALKDYAVQAGLLLMGPGAGTAFLNGAALGFANAVPRGPVGIVSAAGTGLQEVAALLARCGVGLTQGIGVGGRDLKAAVGGRMTLASLQALQADPATQVIVLVSKPPAEVVVGRVLEAVASGEKPVVTCFLDAALEGHREIPNLIPALTLQEAALLAAGAAGASLPPLKEYLAEEERKLRAAAAGLRQGLQPEQRYLRGLFSGGTLCYEAQRIWQDLLPSAVRSNAPLKEEDRLPDSARSLGHTCIDLGEEEFTVGRPHPMIDNDLRIRRLLQEGRDPQAAVLVLDVVLGFGAHPDPATELGEAIARARSQAQAENRRLPVVASVTGTPGDPQGYDRQVARLEAAGAVVCASNASAARLAAWILTGET